MIDSLPELVIEILIDRFLSHEDRINLMLTCKGLKNIVGRKKIKNLFVFFAHPCTRRMFYTNLPIGYTNSLRIQDPNSKILNELSKFKETFKYLQKLVVYFSKGNGLNDEYTHLSMEKLNCFEHLEHLELYGFNYLDGNLSLKNLKIFSLESNCDIFLNCEQLKAINIEYLATPKFTKKTSSSLIHLSFGRDLILDGECFFSSYRSSLIETCENLSVLKMTEFGDLNPFLIKASENKLKVPSLKEIRLEETGILPDFEVLIQSLKKPFSPLKKIKIFLNRKLMSLDELIKLNNFVKKNKTKFWNAFEIIIEDPFYDCLLDSVSSFEIMDNSKLNKKSIEILKNVSCLEFSNKLKIDDELWNTMLEAWENKLCSIDFDSYTTQNQFDQMPDYFTNQICLTFGKECKLESYEFLTRFKNLIQVRFHREIKKDDLNRLLRGCRFLYSIEFYVNGEFITIGINRQEKYFKFFSDDARYRDKEPLKFDTLETLIDYCYSFNQSNKNIDMNTILMTHS